MTMTLAEQINALSFDTVFYIEDGAPVEITGEYAPEVYHDDASDIDIQGDGWEAFTGITNQYSYRGGVMHSSEYIGEGLTDLFLDNADEYMFCIVVVNDIDDPDNLVGWAILHKALDYNC